jgi:transcriptional regulator with XRE-family HTH domain
MEQPKITLRAARNNLVLTRKQASKLLKIHYETLTKYEYDSSNIPISFYNQIEEVYGIPLEFIFIGNEQAFVKSMKERLESNWKLERV